jgi:hypothetical protein
MATTSGAEAIDVMITRVVAGRDYPQSSSVL